MLLSFFFVNFTNFAKNFFIFLPSIDLGDSKTMKFVKGSYDMLYLGKEHIYYLVISGGIFFAFDVFLLIILFFSLRNEKNKINTRLENNKKSLEKFGILFLGYKRKFFYWEFVIWIRKLFISFFLYFFKTTSDKKYVRFQLINVLILYIIAYIV